MSSEPCVAWVGTEDVSLSCPDFWTGPTLPPRRKQTGPSSSPPRQASRRTEGAGDTAVRGKWGWSGSLGASQSQAQRSDGGPQDRQTDRSRAADLLPEFILRQDEAEGTVAVAGGARAGVSGSWRRTEQGRMARS